MTGSPCLRLDPICLLVYMRYAITGLVCVPGMQQYHAACNWATSSQHVARMHVLRVGFACGALARVFCFDEIVWHSMYWLGRTVLSFVSDIECFYVSVGCCFALCVCVCVCLSCTASFEMHVFVMLWCEMASLTCHVSTVWVVRLLCVLSVWQCLFEMQCFGVQMGRRRKCLHSMCRHTVWCVFSVCRLSDNASVDVRYFVMRWADMAGFDMPCFHILCVVSCVCVCGLSGYASFEGAMFRYCCCCCCLCWCCC